MNTVFRVCASIVVLLLMCVYVAFAAISLSTTTPYSQSLDSLGTPATATTASTLPADFRVDATTTSTASHTVSGSLGAEYTMSQRFGFFGEVGIALGFASVEPVSTHNSNLRTSVGAILFF